MHGMKFESQAARLIADSLRDPFVLVDIGCSSGIHPGFRTFADRLNAYAFDPDLPEVKRLRSVETNPGVQYFCAFLGLDADHPLRKLSAAKGYWRRNPGMSFGVWPHMTLDPGPLLIPRPVVDLLERESQLPVSESELFAYKAAKKSNVEALLSDPTGAPHTVGLGEALDALGVGHVDFLKLDVDGPDYEILYSIIDRLAEWRTLALGLEVNFYGSDEPHHHTFHNTDRLLRKAGFTLFALAPHPYSSAALPLPYSQGYPAGSIKGRLFQGDAIYVRDFGFRTVGTDAADYGPEKFKKLAALFALLDLPDQAAEVLLRFRDSLAGAGLDVPQMLDQLALEAQGDRKKAWSYEQYMAAFQADHPWFYGVPDEPAPALSKPDQAPVPGAEQSALEAKQATLKTGEPTATPKQELKLISADLSALAHLPSRPAAWRQALSARTGSAAWEYVAFLGPFETGGLAGAIEVGLEDVEEPLYALLADDQFRQVNERVCCVGRRPTVLLSWESGDPVRYIAFQVGEAPEDTSFAISSLRTALAST
jgi:hypothetical protein